MDKVKRFFELKEQWKKGNESQRAEIDKEIASLMADLSPEDDALLEEGVQKDFARIHKDIADYGHQGGGGGRCQPQRAYFRRASGK